MIQRLLLVQLHHLGDVILTTPTIRAARTAFPTARIDFLTGPLGAQVLEGNPHLDSVIVLPTFRQLYRMRYDAVADMHSVPRTALYTFATRAMERIGLRGRGPRNLAYTKLLERETGPVYMARQKLRLIEALGVSAAGADLSLEIAITEAQRAWAKAKVAALGSRIVAISPVSKHEFKQWGIGRWAAVADALAERGASILITSGPGEEEQARAVAERMRHRVLWNYGRTTVRELAALYERCMLWVGNDGGPKHIAAAAGIPTVTVIRRRLGSVWNDVHDARQHFVESGQDSLDTIEPQQVIECASALFS